MQSGQVSWWVPIIVGLLGIAGIAIGQIINTRKEDTRWEREKIREEERWRRETEREERRWERERARDEIRIRTEKEIERARQMSAARLEWRTERLTAYTTYMASVRAFDQGYGVAYIVFDHVDRHTAKDGDDVRLRTVEEAALGISMLAGSDVREAGDQILNVVRSIFRTYNGIVFDEGSAGKIKSTILENLFQRLADSRVKFLDVARSELSVEMQGASESSNGA